jgi:tetratricopeptide (TPR) repeat protein
MRKQDRCADTEAQDAETVNRAIEVLQQLDLEEVERLLRPVIANTPKHYVNEFEKDGTHYVKFWDRPEFMAYSAMQSPSEAARIVWLRNAYPRAHYYMAFVCVERGQWNEAIRWLDAGLTLEPAQAWFRLEKARVLSGVGKYADALGLYASVLEDGMHGRVVLSSRMRAIGLRGLGLQLIELGRLDEAEGFFVASLQHDAESPIARNELEYIHHLRSGGKALPQSGNTWSWPNLAGLACAVCGTEVLRAPRSSDKVVCESCTQRGYAILDCGCVANQVLCDKFAIVVVKNPCADHVDQKDIIQQLFPPGDPDPASVYHAALHALYFGKTGNRESGPPLKFAEKILSALAADKQALLGKYDNDVVHAAVAAMAEDIVRRSKPDAASLSTDREGTPETA